MSSYDRELLGVLEGPWKLLDSVSSLSEDQKLQQLGLYEQLAAAEDRVRQDYTGRYPVELLQNAHDACADAGIRGRVWFRVTESALIVANEGKPFDASRIKALIRLGDSSKDLNAEPEHHTIGYKGIGFTSVFEIADRSQIMSTNIAFELNRARARAEVAARLGMERARIPARLFPFVIQGADFGRDLAIIEELRSCGAVTAIRLPFLSGKTHQQVRDSLRETLPPELLLFMTHVRQIDSEGLGWKSSWKHGHGGSVGLGRVHELTSTAGERRSWLLAEETVPISSALIDALRDDLWAGVKSVRVAAGIPWKRGKPDPKRRPQRLHVYFPTDDFLGRRVLIHGDFYVDASRRRIHDEGAGGRVSEHVGRAVARLMARLAGSVADRGNSLLHCLAKTDDASGYGNTFGNWLIEELRGTPVAIPADGSPPRRASELKRLNSGLSVERERKFVRLVEEPAGVLRPGDDVGAAGGLLKALGCTPFEDEELARKLTPERSGLGYELCMELMAEWIRPRVWSVRSPLQSRPILQNENREWVRPEDAYIRVEGTPTLPEGVPFEVVRTPRRKGAREVLELLEVNELTPHLAVKLVLGFDPEDDEGAAEFLKFFGKVWDVHREAFAGLELGEVLVPARKFRGRTVEWKRADSVYFPRDWGGNVHLEAIYSWASRSEFLAEKPPERRGRKRRAEFFERLGVASAPRRVAIPETSGSKLYETWRGDVAEPNDPCRGTHRNSARPTYGETIDRLEELLAQQDRSASVTLANYLGPLKQPFGPEARISCNHGAHQHANYGKKVGGYQRWLLETLPWVPVSGGVHGDGFARPGEAWFSTAAASEELLLPRAPLAREIAEPLGLVSAARPTAEASSGALRDLFDAYPDLEQAPAAVAKTAIWLLKRLEGVLVATKKRHDDPLPPPPLPALVAGRLTWSKTPVVSDLPALEQLEDLVRLPEGTWLGLRRAFRLRLASETVEVEVIEDGRNASVFLDADRRRSIVALLTRKGVDVGQAAARIGWLKQMVVDTLTLELRYNAYVVRVARDHYLKRRVDSKGRLRGGDLYISRSLLSEKQFFDVSRTLADYLGDEELGDSLLLLLVLGPQYLAQFGVTQSDLEEAEEALERYGVELVDSEFKQPEHTLIDEATDTSSQVEGARSGDGAEAGAATETTVETERSGGATRTRDTSADRTGSRQGTSGPARKGSGVSNRSAPGRNAEWDRPAAARTNRQRQGKFITYVTPSRTDRSAPAPEVENRTSPVDRAGIALVLKYEEDNGRHPKEMPHGNEGYDIESADESGAVVRFIEVKSTSWPWGSRGVALSRSQFELSRGLDVDGTYWLYVVEHATSTNPRIYPIANPARLIDGYIFDHGWRGAAERYPATGVEELEEELQHADPSVRELVEGAVASGATFPEIGYELPIAQRWIVEVAWPLEKVAISIDVDDERDAWLRRSGWTSGRVEEWDLGNLVRSLRPVE